MYPAKEKQKKNIITTKKLLDKGMVYLCVGYCFSFIHFYFVKRWRRKGKGGRLVSMNSFFVNRFFAHTQKGKKVINKMKYPFEYLIIIDTRIYDIDKEIYDKKKKPKKKMGSQ